MVVVSLKAVLNHQDWALEAGSLHVDSKGIIVTKVISEQGSSGCGPRCLKRLVGKAKQEREG